MSQTTLPTPESCFEAPSICIEEQAILSVPKRQLDFVIKAIASYQSYRDYQRNYRRKKISDPDKIQKLEEKDKQLYQPINLEVIGFIPADRKLRLPVSKKIPSLDTKPREEKKSPKVKLRVPKGCKDNLDKMFGTAYLGTLSIETE